MPLNNFGLVTGMAADLYRCAQPDEPGMGTLHVIGVRTVFKLNDGDEPACEGITVIRRPLPSFFYDVREVMAIADDIRRVMTGGLIDPSKHTAVHCTHGRDRTGLVVGAFRLMFCGWSFAQVQVERALYGVVGLDAICDFDMDGMLAEIASLTSQDLRPS